MKRYTSSGILEDARIVLAMLSKEGNVRKMMSEDAAGQMTPWAVMMSRRRDIHNVLVGFIAKEWLERHLSGALGVVELASGGLDVISMAEQFFKAPTRQYSRDEIEFAKKFLADLIEVLGSETATAPPKAKKAVKRAGKRKFVFELVA